MLRLQGVSIVISVMIVIGQGIPMNVSYDLTPFKILEVNA